MDALRLSGLPWTQIVGRSWAELTTAGLPPQLAGLAEELGRRRRRPIRAATMPLLDAGVDGLALPFVAEDVIALDPPLLSDGRHRLGEVVARELGYMLHPHWEDSDAQDYEKMSQFASKVAPMLLITPADYQWADVAALASRRKR